jgi:hypothetical protein
MAACRPLARKSNNEGHTYDLGGLQDQDKSDFFTDGLIKDLLAMFIPSSTPRHVGIRPC